jgi:hypothetical protein
MMERANCSCAICKLEQALLIELQQAQYVEFFNEIAVHYPILSGFPASLEPLTRMRRSPANHDLADSSDAFLGELLRPASGEERKVHRSLLLLLLVPSLHKMTRQIAAGFPLLARDDIVQHLIVTVLQILDAISPDKQKSHLAFSIIRLLRRRSFRWALNERKYATGSETELGDVSEEIEATGEFEGEVFLREFLHSCLSRGLLSEKEHGLLVAFKIDGLGSPLLSAREGLSEVALRHRVQRIIDRLRRDVKAHPQKVESAFTKRLPTSCGTRRSDRVA